MRTLAVIALGLGAWPACGSGASGPPGAGGAEAGADAAVDASADSGAVHGVADGGANQAGGDSAAAPPSDGSSEAGACALTASTSPSGTVTSGCALLDRDTSACAASRAAAGLSGAWLSFSCRVTLAPVTQGGASYVRVSSDGQPDYPSNYFPSTSPCYAAFTPSFPDPNQIAAQSFAFLVPAAPNAAGAAMGLGPVGIAVNGVGLFDNQAAPGDDIYGGIL